MAPREIPTSAISRARYVTYWANATECFEGMKDAALAQRWHLTALNGVHCVIAAADALLVYRAGLRSTSKNHLDVFALLAHHVEDPERDKMLQHGFAVLRQKTDVEYGAKPISESDAYQVVKQVERFYQWVRAKIGQ